MNTIYMIVSYFFHSVKVVFTEDCHLDSVFFDVFILLVEEDNRIHESLSFDVSFELVFGLR